MVSILLAVYNGETYLKKTIESVLNQTYIDFELLIGFNGTVDGSKNIVSNFNDNRIRVFDYGMDSGKSKTLNKLIKEAKGDWLAMQDDDDIWFPKKLEIQLKFASTENYDVIGTKIFYCNEKDNIIGLPFLAKDHKQICLLTMNGYNQVANTSAIFKKSIAFEVQGWNNEIVGAGDLDFWLKLMHIGARFINIDQKLVLHRIHNKSNFNTKKFDIKEITDKYRTKNRKNDIFIKINIYCYLIFSKIYSVFWKVKYKLGK